MIFPGRRRRGLTVRPVFEMSTKLNLKAMAIKMTYNPAEQALEGLPAVIKTTGRKLEEYLQGIKQIVRFMKVLCLSDLFVGKGEEDPSLTDPQDEAQLDCMVDGSVVISIELSKLFYSARAHAIRMREIYNEIVDYQEARKRQRGEPVEVVEYAFAFQREASYRAGTVD